MEAVLKKIFDQKLGVLLKVDAGNVQFSPTAGQLSLRQAEFKADAFDDLHLPVTLRGGFIEEILINISASGLWAAAEPGAKIVIRNVSLLFGPHTTDWSWRHVCDCKSKLVDLVVKLSELKGGEKKAKAAQGGFFADFRQKLADDFMKSLFGVLEVNICNVHVRYEDPRTQSKPFACGLKIGHMDVASAGSADQSPTGIRRRATGDWKYCNVFYADPVMSQAVTARRISAYWDIGKEPVFSGKPVPGQEVRRKFSRLNIRETFSACVVEEIMACFPADHSRRKYLAGPSFRERLDFHQYVVFPMSLCAHVIANRVCDATRQGRAPLKDAVVEVEPMEVAVDTDQIESLNELVSSLKAFDRKDRFLRSRPKHAIAQFLEHSSQHGLTASSPSSSRAEDLATRRRTCVREWWVHAFKGVRELCSVPRASWKPEELREKVALQERYMELCIEELRTAAKEDSRNAKSTESAVSRELRDMQMSLEFPDILSWRQQASKAFRELGMRSSKSTKEWAMADELAGAAAATGSTWARDASGTAARGREKPDSLQVQVNAKALNLYFLVCSRAPWLSSIKGVHGSTGSSTLATMRQLVLEAQVTDVRAEAVQKGYKKRRIARWSEITVGSINANNLSAKKANPAARSILAVLPFERLEGDGSSPEVCLRLAVTSLEADEKCKEVHDTPLSAVLEPWLGLPAHLRVWPQEESFQQVRRLGFLHEHKDDLGKLMTFAYVRIGLVRAMHYVPLEGKFKTFLTRGQHAETTMLFRRPSPQSLDKTLMNKLQKKVEAVVGKSNMLGTLDVEADGVRARLVDNYNMRKVLCKEVALAPMHFRLLRNGCPQAFQMQLRKLSQPEDHSAMQRVRTNLSSAASASFDLLPWRVSMHLLERADFSTSLLDDPPAPLPQLAAAAKEVIDQQGFEKEGVQQRPRESAPAMPTDLPLPGAYFRKWGRNGRSRQRFVVFDESLGALAWKSHPSSKSYNGAIPLAKIEDICTGIKTPVLMRAPQVSLRPDCCWSVVASDRTLDLEADTAGVVSLWVTWLRAKYKSKVASFQPEPGRRPTLTENAKYVMAILPKALERKTKSYPAAFRPPDGELCNLKSTCKKMQAVQALGKVFDANGGIGGTATKIQF